MIKRLNNINYDIVIIGADISGIVLAGRHANIKNRNVLIIEKRNYIRGNCFDFINNDGIFINKNRLNNCL